MGTSQSSPTDETPNESNEGYGQDLFYYPPLSTPIDQTSNRPDQYYLQDPYNYPPSSMPTDQTPYEQNQGYFQDPYNYPFLSMSTDQTPNQDQAPSEPVQGYSQDGSNPPLGQTSDQNRKCCSCSRPESTTEEEHTNLGDGRYLCSKCLSISIMEPGQLKPVISQVYTFFEQYLKVPVKMKIRVFLVKANGFTEIPEPSTGVGELLYREVTIQVVKSYKRRGAEIEAITKMKKVKGDQVPTILLLFGLPKQIVGGSLASMMVHALIRLQDWPFLLEKDVEESICQAVAYKWLRYTGDNNNDPSYTQEDAEFAIKFTMYAMIMMKKGAVPCKSAEFWKARRAIEKYGLEDTLAHVALTRSIPE